MIDAGGRRLHIYEAGSGSPTVLLEAGLAATSLSWRIVQNEIAKFTRVISYDRAGLGWSDPAPSAPTLNEQVQDLRAVLSRASPPYVLVAHSFGAQIVRAYANRYSDVCGLVLVDPLRPEEWHPLSEERRRMLARGIALSRRGAFLARLGIVGWCLRSVLAGSRWLPKAAGKTFGGRGMTVVNRLAGEVAKMPRDLWPMVVEHWSAPKSFLAMAAQLEMLPAGAEQGSGLPEGLRSIVLRPGESAKRSGHWIHLDEPELVVDAIRQLVNLQRERSLVRP